MNKTEVGEIGLPKDRTALTKPTKVTIGTLYEQYYDRIVRYIFIRISDQAEAENLGGDVFLKALQSLDSYRGDIEQMRAWLFRIAHNLVVDYIRKVSKRRTISIDSATEMQLPDKINVEETVETQLEIERLSTALERLTPAQREVIGLRFFAGLSSAETSNILGRNNGAIREMQRAAIETLRIQMGVEAK